MSGTQVRALLERHGLRPRRDLGQNFLVDDNLAARLAERAGVTSDDADGLSNAVTDTASGSVSEDCAEFSRRLGAGTGGRPVTNNGVQGNSAAASGGTTCRCTTTDEFVELDNSLSTDTSRSSRTDMGV